MRQLQTDTLRSPAQDTTGLVGKLPELGPLYEPPPVAFSFEAPGWTILGGLLVIALLVLGFFWLRHYRRNRYRREALAALRALAEKPEFLAGMLAVLKRTAMQAFGRDSVAGLYGRDWLEFLDKTGKEVTLLRYERELLDALYKNRPLADEVYRRVFSQAMKWIQTHARKF